MKKIIFIISFAILGCLGDGTFVKYGNNGTVSCEAFCQGPQWGKVGFCVSSKIQDTDKSETCQFVPGLIPEGKHLICVCTTNIEKKEKK